MTKTMTAIAMALFAGTAYGAVAPHNHISTPAEEKALDEAFAWSAPEEQPDGATPRFVLRSRDGKFILGAGAQIKAVAMFDFGAPIDNPNDFDPSSIPSAVEPGEGARWQFSAQSSALWLNAVAFPDSKNRVGAYINVNFHGDDYMLQIQYAYLKWRSLTAGYGYSLFADVPAAPATVDYEGPNSFTGVQGAVFNLEMPLGRNGRWTLGAGINSSMASIAPTEMTKQVSQRLPDIPAYIQYNHPFDGHLRLSAILRNLYYRDLRAGRNLDMAGWGVKLSGMASAGPCNFYMQVLGGRGVTSYYQDLIGDELDLAVSSGDDSRRALTASWGGYVGVDYAFAPRWCVLATASTVHLYPGDGYRLPDVEGAYRHAEYLSGTLTYSITGQLSAQLEYLYGIRHNPGGTTRHDTRLQTALTFAF